MDFKGFLAFILIVTPWTFVVPGVFYFYKYLKIKICKGNEPTDIKEHGELLERQESQQEQDAFKKAIQEGLEDEKAGRLISHDEVLKIMKK